MILSIHVHFNSYKMAKRPIIDEIETINMNGRWMLNQNWRLNNLAVGNMNLKYLFYFFMNVRNYVMIKILKYNLANIIPIEAKNIHEITIMQALKRKKMFILELKFLISFCNLKLPWIFISKVFEFPAITFKELVWKSTRWSLFVFAV